MSVKNEFYIVIISLLCVFLISAILAGWNHDKKQNNVINEKDDCIYELNEKLIMQNIEVENYKDSIILYNDSINSLIKEFNSINKGFDSINKEFDSINEELQVNKIKIERIREYNRIAAQGNNIKFLRGWINRVIE